MTLTWTLAYGCDHPHSKSHDLLILRPHWVHSPPQRVMYQSPSWLHTLESHSPVQGMFSLADCCVWSYEVHMNMTINTHLQGELSLMVQKTWPVAHAFDNLMPVGIEPVWH